MVQIWQNNWTRQLKYTHTQKHIYKYNTNKLIGKRYYSTTGNNNNNEKKNVYTWYDILGLSLIIIIASYLLIYKTDFLKSPLSFISSGLFTSSLVLLYMDNFKLSSNCYIKYLQIFSFVCIPLSIIFYLTNITFLWSIYTFLLSYSMKSILESILISITSFLYTYSIILFYLDNFKLNENKWIKYTQIFSFVATSFIIILLIYNNIYTDIINHIKDGDNDIHLHGHVSIDKDTGKAIGQGIGQGISTVGSQWGLGGTIVGVSTAVSKTLAKSSIPPLQKAGIIVASGVFGGFAHSAISFINRNAIRTENIITSSSNTTSSQISKFIDDSSVSSLQGFLFSAEMMNYACLSLLYFLIIQLVFKLYFKDTIKLNLSKLLGTNTNTKLEYYFIKIIKFNKQMSIIWIWFIFIILIIKLGIEAYSLYKLSINLDSFIDGYISFNPNFTDNSTYSPNKSINDILLNLKVNNYIYLFAIIFLMFQVILKFHFNKNINNIYIWLVLLILIVALAFAAYTYGDLYIHIDSYVNMYINLRNK